MKNEYSSNASNFNTIFKIKENLIKVNKNFYLL